MSEAATQAPEPAYIDAEVIGEVSDDILDRSVTMAVSPREMDRAQGHYRNVTATVRDWLNSTLAMHPIGKSKDGKHVLAGSLVGDKRNANAVKTMEWLTLDLDAGEDLPSVVKRIQELGLFAVVHTTWSHTSPETLVKKDEVLRWIGPDATEAAREQVCAFLASEKRYRAHVLEGAELVETAHTPEGIKYRLRHAQMTKLRVWFLLNKPFVIAERAAKQADAIAEWRDRYRGMARLLDVAADRKCVDPSRLWFPPRHPNGKPWRSIVIAGKELDIDTVARVSERDERRASDPMAQAGVEMGGGDYKTSSIKRFFAKYGHLFDVDAFLLDTEPDGDRGPRSSGIGRIHRCPNDDAHSNAGDEADRGFFCVSATESDSGGAVAHCSHDSCAALDRIDFVDMVCERHGIADAEELRRWVPEIIEENDDGGAGGANDAPRDNTESADGLGTSAPIEWPNPFKNKNGAFGWMSKADGEPPRFNRICDALDLLGKTRNEHGTGWSLLLAFKDDAGERKEMAIPLGKLLSEPNSALNALADAGLGIVNHKVPKGRLLEVLSEVKTDRIITDATKTGWYGHAYLPAMGDAIGTDRRTLRLAESARPDSIRPLGTLEGWKDNVAETYAVCDFHCSIALSGEFAGPLVGLLDATPIMVALTGDSSCGKSLSMKIAAAASSDPAPKKGAFVTAYGTAVGLEERIARANHGCIYVDELRLMDPHDVGTFVMAYSSGTDKDRGKAQGGLRKTRSSTGAAVLSNECGIRETIEGAGVDYVTGIGVRCIDIDVSGARTCDDAARVMALELAIGKHYGHAVSVFIRHLQASGGYVEHPDKLVTRITDRVAWLLGDGQHKAAQARAARVLATFMVGLEVARESGVLPAVVTVATIEDHFRGAWNASVGDGESNAVNDASKAPGFMQGRLMELWDIHGWDEEQEEADTPDNGRPRHLNRERLFHTAPTFNDQGTLSPFIAVKPTGLAKLLPKGVKANAVKKLLHKHGLMLRRQDGQFSFYNLPKGHAPYPHYRLDARYFGPGASLELPELLLKGASGKVVPEKAAS